MVFSVKGARVTHHMIVMACLSVAALSVGCAGKATIYTTSGESIKGSIEGSSETYLYVDQGTSEPLKVERARVLGINHPGRALILLGAIGSLIYVPITMGETWDVFASSRARGERVSAADVIPLSTPSALTLAMLGLGVYKRRRSTDAAYHPLDVDFVYPPLEKISSPNERSEATPDKTSSPALPYTTRSWTSFQAVQ